MQVREHEENRWRATMAIIKSIRDKLLVEARHRCTICAEKCFEVHHIIEQADGGTDDYNNLIVLCPNCHQHRYHRSGEFTRDQLIQYKANLIEKNELEKRLLLDLEEIRLQLGNVSPDESLKQLNQAIKESSNIISDNQSDAFKKSISDTAHWLAEHDLMRKGAREAIEIEWEIKREQEKGKYQEVALLKVDDDAYKKANDFERAYTLVFVLDRTPYPEWEKAFMHTFRNSLYCMKRSTEIDRDRIVMIVADTDNLQAHADFAKRLVNDTNKFIKDVIMNDLDTRINIAKQDALREFDAIQSLKNRTKDIKL